MAGRTVTGDLTDRATAFREADVRETPLGRTGAELPVDGGPAAHGGVTSVSDALREGAPP